MVKNSGREYHITLTGNKELLLEAKKVMNISEFLEDKLIEFLRTGAPSAIESLNYKLLTLQAEENKLSASLDKTRAQITELNIKINELKLQEAKKNDERKKELVRLEDEVKIKETYTTGRAFAIELWQETQDIDAIMKRVKEKFPTLPNRKENNNYNDDKIRTTLQKFLLHGAKNDEDFELKKKEIEEIRKKNVTEKEEAFLSLRGE